METASEFHQRFYETRGIATNREFCSWRDAIYWPYYIYEKWKKKNRRIDERWVCLSKEAKLDQWSAKLQPRYQRAGTARRSDWLWFDIRWCGYENRLSAVEEGEQLRWIVISNFLWLNAFLVFRFCSTYSYWCSRCSKSGTDDMSGVVVCWRDPKVNWQGCQDSFIFYQVLHKHILGGCKTINDRKSVKLHNTSILGELNYEH